MYTSTPFFAWNSVPTGAKIAPFFKKGTISRGAVLQNSTPMHTNMIINS